MPGPTEWLIILIIVALLFGTKKLRNMGSDLGSAVKSFRHAVSGKDELPDTSTKPDDNVIDGQVEVKEKTNND